MTSASLYVWCGSDSEAAALAHAADMACRRWAPRLGRSDALGFLNALPYMGCTGWPAHVEFIGADGLVLLASWSLWTDGPLPLLLTESPTL